MSVGTTVIDDKLKQYRAIEVEISELFTKKQNTLSQFNENTLVKGELDLLEKGTPIFKLVGPVLMSVEQEEANENVSKRLEFIEAEIAKLDAAIAAKQGKQAEIGDEIAKIQQQMQQDAATAAKEIAAAAAST